MKSNLRITQALFAVGVAALVGGIVGGLLIPDAQGTLKELFTVLRGFGAGLSATTAIIWARTSRAMRDPETRKLVQIEEHDERNIRVREKAGFTSWFVSLIALVVVVLILAVFAGPLSYGLAVAALLIHCIGYLVLLRHYNKLL